MLCTVLRSPRVYISIQRLLGADRLRRIALADFLHLREGERVLDIGCGPGQVLDDMPDVDYFGFDTEPRYIAYAQRRYAGRGTFVCDQFQADHAAALAPVDAIMLFGVIHHMDDVMAQSLLAVLSRCLTPTARIVTIDPCFTPDQSMLSRWTAKADRGKFVRSEPEYRRVAEVSFRVAEARILHGTCSIPSTELIMTLRHRVTDA